MGNEHVNPVMADILNRAAGDETKLPRPSRPPSALARQRERNGELLRLAEKTYAEIKNDMAAEDFTAALVSARLLAIRLEELERGAARVEELEGRG